MKLTATAFALLVVLEGCLPQFSCDNAGCIDGADLVLSYSAPMTSLDGGRVRVCRGDGCSDAAIRSNAVEFSVNDLGITSVFLSDSTLKMIVPRGAGVALTNGDVYTIELRDNTGTIVASKRWDATYVDLYPNGEDCGPHCRFAQLD